MGFIQVCSQDPLRAPSAGSLFFSSVFAQYTDFSRNIHQTGKGHDNPLQYYSFLENSRDRRAWRATVHRVVKSWTLLSVYLTHTHTQIKRDLCPSTQVYFACTYETDKQPMETLASFQNRPEHWPEGYGSAVFLLTGQLKCELSCCFNPHQKKRTV